MSRAGGRPGGGDGAVGVGRVRTLRRARAAFAAIAALPLAMFACATQPDFTYYDDDAGDASGLKADGRAAVEASVVDSTTGNDGFAPTDDASDDGGMAPDAEPPGDDSAAPDGSLDAAVEAGCGPIDNQFNCGACGVACDLAHSNTPSCSLLDAGAGLCTYASCTAGFADCDAAAPNVNGCETAITTLANCGACGVSCNIANSVDASCGPTGCTYACAPGFSDCDAAPPNASGCSTSLATVANCGACGLSCNTANSVDAGCGPTGCTYACAPNYANCDTTAEPGNAGGCACNTPACCAASGATPGAGGSGYTCETTHSDGVGQSFYSCQALGTYGEPEAYSACEAYVASIGQPASDCMYPAACEVAYGGGHITVTYDGVFYLNETTLGGYVWIFDGTSGTTTGSVYASGTFCGTSRPVVGTWN